MSLMLLSILIAADPVAERVAFEQKEGVIVMESRQYTFDRAVKISSGSVIEGRSSQWRSLKTDGHPLNATAYVYQPGAGWIDPIKPPSGAQVTLHDPSQASNYPPGRLVYVWAAGQGPPPFPPGVDPTKFGLVNQRRKVVSRTGPMITLDAQVDQRCTAIVWLADAVPVPNVPRDSNAILAKPGLYWLTSGKSVADELRGEWVDVGDNSKLTRSTARAYETAAVAKIVPIQNVIVRNVHFQNSPNCESLFIKYARNWSFQDCTFDGAVQVASASDFEFTRCVFKAPVKLNMTARVTFRGCTLATLGTEECDTQTRLEGCQFLNSDNGVISGIQCERMTIQGATFQVRASAFLLGGPDNRLEDVRVFSESESYLHGPRLSVRGYTTPGRVIFYNGDDQRLDGVRASTMFLGWVNGNPSSGVYRDCTPPTMMPTATRWIQQ